MSQPAAAAELFDQQALDSLPALRDVAEKADNGVAHAMTKIAFYCGSGEYVKEQSWVDSTVWYAAAAELGDADAMFCVGIAHARGRGVQQDWAGAVSWFQQSADKGCATAMYNLGYCYKKGHGDPPPSPPPSPSCLLPGVLYCKGGAREYADVQSNLQGSAKTTRRQSQCSKQPRSRAMPKPSRCWPSAV